MEPYLYSPCIPLWGGQEKIHYYTFTGLVNIRSVDQQLVCLIIYMSIYVT